VPLPNLFGALPPLPDKTDNALCAQLAQPNAFAPPERGCASGL